MDLIWLVIVVVVIGFVVWLLTTYVPMPSPWPRVIQIVALVIVVLWVLTRFVHIPNVIR